MARGGGKNGKGSEQLKQNGKRDRVGEVKDSEIGISSFAEGDVSKVKAFRKC